MPRSCADLGDGGRLRAATSGDDDDHLPGVGGRRLRAAARELPEPPEPPDEPRGRWRRLPAAIGLSKREWACPARSHVLLSRVGPVVAACGAAPFA